MTKQNYADEFEYLDELRLSGETNMYGAASYLMRDHGLIQEDARECLKAWMDTFDPEKTGTQRAKEYAA